MSDLVNVKISKREVSYDTTYSIASKAVRLAEASRLTVSSAESCTGGLIGGALTDVPGSSAVYLGGIITYTNEVKINVLGVDGNLIDRYTEVSEAVARQMAQKVREKLGSDIGVSATGFAGPSGGNENDPKGTVYIGISTSKCADVYRLSFFPEATRDEIRRICVEFALEKLILLCA